MLGLVKNSTQPTVSRHGRNEIMRTALVTAVLASPLAGSAGAQSAIPTRTLKIIVPFPGGGFNAVLAGIVGGQLRAKWGQPVVLENTTGGGGNIGAGLA